MKRLVKRNTFEVVNANLGFIFEVVKDQSKSLEKLVVIEKEEFRKMLFLFWWTIKIFETYIFPAENAKFELFYKQFYQNFPFLRYKVEESYNIPKNEYYPIFLKVKVNDKLVKKDWFF